MAFQVVYPDTDLVAELSATPATKATLNSSGIIVETSATTSSSLSASSLEITVSATEHLHADGNSVHIYAGSLNSSLDYGALTITNATASSFMSVSEFRTTTNTEAGGLTARVLTDRLEIGNDTDAEDIKLATLDPEKLHFFRNGSGQDIVMDASGTKLSSGPFQPSSLLDVSGNAGTAGQYLLSNGVAPVWTTVSAPGTPTLQEVVTAGNTVDDGTQIRLFDPAQVGAVTDLGCNFISPHSADGNAGRFNSTQVDFYDPLIGAGYYAGLAYQRLSSKPVLFLGNTQQGLDPPDVAINLECPAGLQLSGSAGTADQYLASQGPDLPPVWADLPAPTTPNLADVLAVATAGDANSQPISNLSELGFAPGIGTPGYAPLVISGSPNAAATNDILYLNYEVDATSGRTFSQKYLEIKVNDGPGTKTYWLPLFDAPLP